MAFTLQQLDALENAIASGTPRCSYDGKSVDYASFDVMMRIRDMMQRALGVTPNTSRTIFASHDRGFPGGLSVADDSELYSGW